MNTFNKIKTAIRLMGFAAASVLAVATSANGQAKWVAPSAAAAVKNPNTCNDATLKDGKKLYTSLCAPCHGDKGKGDGPAAGALTPKPANHTSPAVQAESDGSLFWKISEGRGAMAAYKGQLTEPQRWSLVCFIRSLKK
jgi:mono/diheme cytochrome c family protein